MSKLRKKCSYIIHNICIINLLHYANKNSKNNCVKSCSCAFRNLSFFLNVSFETFFGKKIIKNILKLRNEQITQKMLIYNS